MQAQWKQFRVGAAKIGSSAEGVRTLGGGGGGEGGGEHPLVNFEI